MILKQFYLNCLAHASYVVGDEQAGVAAVVDPQRDVQQYLAFAQEHGLRITHVVLTHLHADFLAGHLELRDRTGATVCLGAKATAEYAFRPLGDGDAIELGRVRLTALETPGHTPESISLQVFDLGGGGGRGSCAALAPGVEFFGTTGAQGLELASGGIFAVRAGVVLAGGLVTARRAVDGSGCATERPGAREVFSWRPWSREGFVVMVVGGFLVGSAAAAGARRDMRSPGSPTGRWRRCWPCAASSPADCRHTCCCRSLG